MKFGVHLPNCGGGLVYPSALSKPEGVVKIALEAEALGYDSLWVNDHLVTPSLIRGNTAGAPFLEPLITLTYLSALTVRVRLGVGAVILPLRNPIVLAKETATLDVLSGGRVILGVGVGRFEDEFKPLNIPFQARGEILDEYIKALNELWTKPLANFEGKYVSFRDAEVYPKPRQARCPIWICGNSRRAARRAATLGDGWMPGLMLPEEIEESLSILNRELRRVGRSTSEIEVASENIISIMRDERAAEANFGRFPYSQIVKYVPSVKERSLIGKPDSIMAKIEHYTKTGVEHFILIFAVQSVGDMLETMKLFSTEVMPSFK